MNTQLRFAALSLLLLTSSGLRAQGIYNLWGMASTGGNSNDGAIFKTAADGSNAVGVISFSRGVTGTGTNPYGSLMAYNGKLYGLTFRGGANNGGTVFYIDPAAATPSITKLADFTNGTTGNGNNPYGSLVVYNGKLYGLAANGGARGYGTVFSVDPAAATPAIIRLDDFINNTNGAFPDGSLVAYNSKLYGLTRLGGFSNVGSVFSIDPADATPTITTLTDFSSGTTGTGATPVGSLTVYNSKLYGLTATGGANNVGTVFSFDPAAATPSITKMADFTTGSTGNGANPFGSLVVYNSKLYGLTPTGGANSGGTVFSIDPAAAMPSITKLADFTPGTTGTGTTPYGSLVVYNGKLYGMTSDGGANAAGTVFSIDPAAATPTVIKTSDLSSNTGMAPQYGQLLPYAASVASGTAGSCESEPTITGTGNAWKGILNSTNDAVAEINPNGNNLGTVSAYLYTRSTTGTIREDAVTHKTYLDRNVTITPATQPNSNVGVRIYITDAEYQHLKTSTNSLGAPSGIGTMTDLQLYQISGACASSGTIPSSMTPLGTSVTAWAGGGYVLSTSVSSLSAFYIGKGIATNVAGISLRSAVKVTPSPTHDYLNISTNALDLTATLSDMQGKVQMQFTVSNGTRVNISSLPTGIYLLRMSSGEIVKVVKE